MIWKFIKELFCKKELPLWSHGLLCNVCMMSFGTAQKHFDHVMKVKTLDKHEDKIPVLNA